MIRESAGRRASSSHGTNRLSEWRSFFFSKSKGTTFSYDTVGNLTDAFVDFQLAEHNSYGLPGGGMPHALTQQVAAGVATSFAYDAHGRQTTGARHPDNTVSSICRARCR